MRHKEWMLQGTLFIYQLSCYFPFGQLYLRARLLVGMRYFSGGLSLERQSNNYLLLVLLLVFRIDL